MVEVINTTVTALTGAYDALTGIFPNSFQQLPGLIIISFLIALYGMFIWVFHRFLAKRDLIKINLNKYNVFEHAGLIKLFAIVFYILEFIIILPFVAVFWFSIFSILLIMFAKDQPVTTAVLISASIIAAIRITAYYKESLALDLAKLFPFTLLGVAILTPGFFNVSTTIDRLSQIPLLLNNLLVYAVFIILIEIILRLTYLISSYFLEE